MNFDLKECVKLFEEQNDEITKENARAILLLICDRLIRHPDEMKCRQIRLQDESVTGVLLSTIGAMECLFAAGFIEV